MKGMISSSTGERAEAVCLVDWYPRAHLWLLLASLWSGLCPAAVLTAVQVTEFQFVGSTRVNRAIFEYTLRPVATNTTGNLFRNVTATLTATPTHVSVIDGTATFGSVAPGETLAASDTIVLRVNVRSQTTKGDLVWQVNGTQVTSSVPRGQVGIFMSVEGGRIAGESVSEAHPDWIEVVSVNHEGNTMSLVKQLDLSTTGLLSELVNGTHLGEVQIEMVRQCGTEIYISNAWILTDVVITRLDTNAGGDARPNELITLQSARTDWMNQPVSSGCRLESPQYGSF